jgi:hypothetical protein
MSDTDPTPPAHLVQTGDVTPGPGPHRATPDGDEVPTNAADVVEWLREEGIDDTERNRRADLADRTEADRTGDARSTVTDAIASARGQ